jgi:adenine/guanine phosphoribosyltransferase-like PRPP-binding protein
MPLPDTNAEALALQALVWTLGDQGRASRLLDLTGLDPSSLRARAGEPALLAATLGFLEAHEPDLIACADALGVAPAALVAARTTLERA